VVYDRGAINLALRMLLQLARCTTQNDRSRLTPSSGRWKTARSSSLTPTYTLMILLYTGSGTAHIPHSASRHLIKSQVTLLERNNAPQTRGRFVGHCYMRLPYSGKRRAISQPVLLHVVVPGGRIARRVRLWSRGRFLAANPLIDPGSPPGYLFVRHAQARRRHRH